MGLKVTSITRITRGQLHSPNESRGHECCRRRKEKETERKGKKAQWVNHSRGDTSDGQNKSLVN